jgi:aryl-alcohol dehydrogenase-like predicted oxidoreductase
MQTRAFGRLGPISALTLGGGGIGMVWGSTSHEECVATTRDAVAAGVTLLDLAPSYGNGTAERVVGEAFGGALPAGVRVTSKCGLGDAPAAGIEPIIRKSIADSLGRLRVRRLDLFFLHSNVAPDADAMLARPDAARRMTRYSTFVQNVRPLFERLVAEGLIGAWGLTGIGHPDAIIRLLNERPAPAAVQCIANLLDSPGGLKFFDARAKPRQVIAEARTNGVAVMGIRAVQAGALTRGLDRTLAADHPEMRDFARAAGFRRWCDARGEDPAVIAHRYALGMDIDTLVLGVKNRAELAAALAAAEAGPLPPAVMAEVDATVDRSADA